MRAKHPSLHLLLYMRRGVVGEIHCRIMGSAWLGHVVKTKIGRLDLSVTLLGEHVNRVREKHLLGCRAYALRRDDF